MSENYPTTLREANAWQDRDNPDGPDPLDMPPGCTVLDDDTEEPVVRLVSGLIVARDWHYVWYLPAVNAGPGLLEILNRTDNGAMKRLWEYEVAQQAADNKVHLEE